MFKNYEGFDEYIRKSYIDENKSMAKIAKELHCSSATVLHHIRRCQIPSKKNSDYETTESQREAGRKAGIISKGRKLSEAQKQRISEAQKGKRKRLDYEFGGHEKIRDDGYIKVYVPDHPNASEDGYVMKHRLAMERALGCIIPRGYVVHHINHDRKDNRIENLALMTFSAHARLHMMERKSKI